jgi:cytochrome c oxidase subunit 2
MWFRPIKAGKYEIVCAQLCGAGHYAMRSHLIVDSQEKFDEQIKELSAMQHPAAAAAPAQ